MAAFNKFNDFVQQLASKTHNLGSDALKVCLTNTAPTSSNTILSNITQISAGNGYTTGGNAVASLALANTAGTSKLTGSNVVFTASGGAVGPFRYAVLYNSTTGSGNLIGWFDYGSAVTLNDTETLTVAWDGTNGIMTIA